MGRLYGAAASAGDPLAGVIGSGVVVFGKLSRMEWEDMSQELWGDGRSPRLNLQTTKSHNTKQNENNENQI